MVRRLLPRAVELGTHAFPAWTTVLAWAFLLIAACCAVWILADVVRHPQEMAVMNVVWPVTALFGGVFWLLFYRRWGRPRSWPRPFPISVAIGTSHCGAGCAVGDVIGEFGLVAFPVVASLVGLGHLYSDRMIAGWIVDFVIAYAAGVVFQHFAIAPMRQAGVRDALVAAVKADAASIVSWQVGMYGGMAIAQLLLLPAWFGGWAAVLTPQFWTVMQVAMMCGFLTAYPVNWLLVRRGVKEAM